MKNTPLPSNSCSFFIVKNEKGTLLLLYHFLAYCPQHLHSESFKDLGEIRGGYLHSHCGDRQHRCCGSFRCNLCQSVLLVLRAAPSAQLARCAAGVAAGQEAKHTHTPQEPARGPTAPAHDNPHCSHTQNHIQRQQRNGRLGIWRRKDFIKGLGPTIPSEI